MTVAGELSGSAMGPGSIGNSLFGAVAGRFTTGYDNSFFGHFAGYSNVSGNRNTAVGDRADVTSNDLTNATAIGSWAKVGCSNCLVLGNAANVGIGTSTPQSALQVNGYVQLALTSGAPPAADCDEATEQGRMKVDGTNNKLYICTSTGWKSTVLAP